MTQGAQTVFALVLVASSSVCAAWRVHIPFSHTHNASVNRTHDISLFESLLNATNVGPNNRGHNLPLFDNFVFAYWGIVFAFMITTLAVTHFSPPKEEENKALTSGEPEEDLAESIWSLNLVSAVGQATLPNGNPMSPYLVGLISVTLAAAQLFTLFLIVDSMDPAATPITTVPLTPWKTPEQSWTVNCMKWLMVTFLSMSVVPEAGDAIKELMQSLQIDKRRLLCSRVHLMILAVLHYLITMGVVIAGVSVILSCQDVGSILFNSLAVTFINGLDDTIYKFFEGVCGIESDFKIVHKDLDGDGEPDIWDMPLWADVLQRFVILFPCLYGVFLIGRAWYTGKMPSVVLRFVYSVIST